MYYTQANDPLTEQQMNQFIEDYRHDGAVIERVRAPIPGVVVQLPGQPERFYREE